MANTGFKGLDVRQTGNELVFRAFLQTSAGALVTSGTTNFYIMELQSDGTIKTYDFNDNTFKSTACTTENLAGAYRKSNNAATDTGLWTASLATLTGFTAGSIYLVRVNNSGASPTDQVREFQYGSEQGDLVVTANGTGVGELNVDVKMLLGTAWLAPGVAGTPDVNMKLAGGTAVTLDSNNTLNVNAKYWNALATVALPLVPATAGRTLVVDASGLADANAVKVGPTGAGTAQTARDIGASVLLSTGTGTGQLDFTSGVVKSNMVQIIATALTESVGGYLAAGFKALLNVASPVFTLASVNQTVDASTRMATYTQPTGFLVANFTTGAPANVLQYGGTNGTFSGGRPEVNTVKFAGSTITCSAGVTIGTTIATTSDVTSATSTIDGQISSATGGLAQSTDISTLTNYIGSNVATSTMLTAVKAKTDLIPAAPASTTNITAASGVALSATGANLVLIDGVAFPKAFQIVSAVIAGKITDAGTTTEIFVGLDGSTTRATFTVDSSGNRSAATYNTT